MPKSSSSDLFRLIKSLSKGEKAFVSSRFGKRENDSSLSMQMMQLIDNQTEYNEPAIINSLVITNSQTARIKNYLFEHIIDSVAQLSQLDEPAGEIRKLLNQKEVLFKKRLFKACEKKLLKALNLADQAELFNYYAEISSGLLHVIEIQGDKERLLATSNKLRLKIKEIFNHQILLAQLKDFKYKHMFGLHQLYGNNDKLRKIYGNGRKLIAELDTLKIKSVKSKTAKLQYYNYLGLILYTFDQKKEALDVAYKAIRLFKNERLFTQQHYRLYLHGINNYLLLGQPYLNYKEVKSMLLTLQQCAADFEKIDYIKTNALARYHFFRLLSCFRFNLTVGLENTANQVAKWLDTHNDELIDQVNYTKGIEFLLSAAYFIEGRYKESLRYAQNIINLKLLNNDYHITRINFLLLHFELNNFELLQSLIRSTERHFKKDYPFRDLGLFVCSYLKRAAVAKNKVELKLLFSNMHAEFLFIKDQPALKMQLSNFEHSSALIIERWCLRKAEIL